MTYILSIDPGLNTGAAIGFYDAITPYRLIERLQIHDGVVGFEKWWTEYPSLFFVVDEIVCERFDLREENEFAADLTPVQVEGALLTLLAQTKREFGIELEVKWQPASDKGSLIGYPANCTTRTERQRFRFDFLDRFGLFKAGTENDDSNDAITHALVYLRRRGHYPTKMAFWPPPSAVTRAPEAPSYPAGTVGF